MNPIESERLYRFEPDLERQPSAPARVGRVLAIASLFAGGAGMALSFLTLGVGDKTEVVAGAAGFVAGAILVGSGLIAFCILARYHE